MTSRILVHYSGGIAENHQISMRTLAKSLSHLQSAIDRAYLEHKHGYLQKHAKMYVRDYEDILFVTSASEEGGYILDFIGKTPIGKIVSTKISSVIRPIIAQSMESGSRETSTKIATQLDTVKAQLEQKVVIPTTYDEFVSSFNNEDGNRSYANRSIAKEFDQIAGIIRSKSTSSDSKIEIKVTGSVTDTFTFDKQVSKKFHSIVSLKSAGRPVLYLAKITKLDFKNLNGKIYNVLSKQESTIKFADENDFF